MAWRRNTEMAIKLREEILAGPAFEAQMSAAGVCTMLLSKDLPPEIREFFKQRVVDVDPRALKRRSFAGQLKSFLQSGYRFIGLPRVKEQ